MSEARRHIIPSQAVIDSIEGALNGKTVGEAKAILLSRKIEGVNSGSIRPNNKSIQAAAQQLLRNFFNEIENLWVGNSVENSTIQDQWDFPEGWTDEMMWAHVIRIKAKYLL